MRPRLVLVATGAAAAIAAAALARGAAGAAVANAWPPFALVLGLLLVGAVAAEDGVFLRLAALLDRLPGGEWALYGGSMALVAVVTAVLNLDTAVAFLTPVLVHTARRREAGEQRLLYGCVFMANAASLLLPGSNLTNLLVLSGEHVSGSVFLARMALPWVASVLVTAIGVAVLVRGGSPALGRTTKQPEAPAQAAVATARPRLGAAGIAAITVLTLAVADPALPILGTGLLLVSIRALRSRLPLPTLTRSIDLPTLAGVFLAALSLGTLARVWSFPATMMARAGIAATATAAAVTAILVNNLPAAVLLGSATPPHPRALLIGLDIGPNLAVTGSLSAVIWWQAARVAGARPSALRYSLTGIVLVPLTIAAALAAGRAVI
ncbi:MAG TPA: SLC13 family permease [Candidatus Dormibacteraeota bacterium]|jgi:arsenical pump membrane protein|nr:SLC13 family permease [Candidatus Dormibacteraeota bacterium]